MQNKDKKLWCTIFKLYTRCVIWMQRWCARYNMPQQYKRDDSPSYFYKDLFWTGHNRSMNFLSMKGAVVVFLYIVFLSLSVLILYTSIFCITHTTKQYKHQHPQPHIQQKIIRTVLMVGEGEKAMMKWCYTGTVNAG